MEVGINICSYVLFQDDSPCQAPARVGKELLLLLLPTAPHSTSTLILQKRRKNPLNITIRYILKYVCFYKQGAWNACDGSLRCNRSVCDSKIQISTAEGLPWPSSTGQQAEISTSTNQISSLATPDPIPA